MHNSLHLMVNINDDDAWAKRESVEFLDHYYGPGTIAPEKLDAWLAFGSPANCLGRLQHGRDSVHLPDQRGRSSDASWT